MSLKINSWKKQFDRIISTQCPLIRFCSVLNHMPHSPWPLHGVGSSLVFNIHTHLYIFDISLMLMKLYFLHEDKDKSPGSTGLRLMLLGGNRKLDLSFFMMAKYSVVPMIHCQERSKCYTCGNFHILTPDRSGSFKQSF